MVKFFEGNGQVFISKKQKDLALKSIPFVLKSYGKMSLLDNQYELRGWKVAMRPSNHKAFSGKNVLLQAPNHLELTVPIILNMWQTIWPLQLWIYVLWFWRKNTAIFVNITPESQPNFYTQPK